MLGTAATTRLVASLVAGLPAGVPVVVDPVCASKHGDPLIDADAVEALRGDLLPGRDGDHAEPARGRVAGRPGRHAGTSWPRRC